MPPDIDHVPVNAVRNEGSEPASHPTIFATEPDLVPTCRVNGYSANLEAG